MEMATEHTQEQLQALTLEELQTARDNKLRTFDLGAAIGYQLHIDTVQAATAERELPPTTIEPGA